MLTILKEFFLKPIQTENFIFDTELIISDSVKTKIKMLSRNSLFIREIDAGSSNDCEHEIATLEGPSYDIARFGFKIVASPRHADLLLVTGPVAFLMYQPLLEAYNACPDPKIVIALGDGAISGEIVKGITNSRLKAVSDCIPVDIEIPGNPPSPKIILQYLLALRKI
jgi:Ni,Fe-hydrogenase III small subunit